MKISLRRRHALTVGNGAFSHTIEKVTILMEILNLEGHQNCITGLRVTPILLNRRILPIGQSGEASRWRVCYQRGLHRLVSSHCMIFVVLNTRRGIRTGAIYWLVGTAVM